MAGGFDPVASGYIEVKDRILAFYEKFPDGSIQSEVVELGEDIVVMKAYAYRSPDDPRPGVGHSQMPIPGLTSFTKHSEVENAETSAWGRAIAALGFEVKRSVASADEVRFKAGDKELPKSATASTASGSASSGRFATPAQKRKLMAEGKKMFGNEAGVREFVQRITGKFKSADLTKDDMSKLFTAMEEGEALMDKVSSIVLEDFSGFAGGSSDEGED